MKIIKNNKNDFQEIESYLYNAFNAFNINIFQFNDLISNNKAIEIFKMAYEKFEENVFNYIFLEMKSNYSILGMHTLDNILTLISKIDQDLYQKWKNSNYLIQKFDKHFIDLIFFKKKCKKETSLYFLQFLNDDIIVDYLNHTSSKTKLKEIIKVLKFRNFDNPKLNYVTLVNILNAFDNKIAVDYEYRNVDSNFLEDINIIKIINTKNFIQGVISCGYWPIYYLFLCDYKDFEIDQRILKYYNAFVFCEYIDLHEKIQDFNINFTFDDLIKELENKFFPNFDLYEIKTVKKYFENEINNPKNLITLIKSIDIGQVPYKFYSNKFWASFLDDYSHILSKDEKYVKEFIKISFMFNLFCNCNLLNLVKKYFNYNQKQIDSLFVDLVEENFDGYNSFIKNYDNLDSHYQDLIDHSRVIEHNYGILNYIKNPTKEDLFLSLDIKFGI